jgi:hypothetical protein
MLAIACPLKRKRIKVAKWGTAKKIFEKKQFFEYNRMTRTNPNTNQNKS